MLAKSVYALLFPETSFFSCLFSFSFRNRSRGKLFHRHFFFLPQMGRACYLHLCTKRSAAQHTHPYKKNNHNKKQIDK